MAWLHARFRRDILQVSVADGVSGVVDELIPNRPLEVIDHGDRDSGR
ncbi:hypothetical protein N136_00107 [Leifsonia aquatica ATCC 14665]|uniref:Uncharacterized protein n=1 Tax=Leifsonia aquatica ATCC 14665 TaxID=1358026 RepID=U2RYG5_LEIAQ|nr:hypothetical protein N136_00107 [Leifsonia aquatica ATCC 14665]